MNKKGVSLSGFTEGIALVVLLLFAIAIIVIGMNTTYNDSKDPSFGMGLQNDATNVLNNLTNYQTNYQNAINNGQASFTAFGLLILSTGYDLLKISVTMAWSVISGTWITKAVALMSLPAQLGLVLQVLYLISIGLALLYVIFRGRI
jgi:hypothetical protein